MIDLFDSDHYLLFIHNFLWLLH